MVKQRTDILNDTHISKKSELVDMILTEPDDMRTNTYRNQVRKYSSTHGVSPASLNSYGEDPKSKRSK